MMKTSIPHTNLSLNELIDFSLARKEGILASNEALTVNTGPRTGRSPKDRFIVQDATTESTVDWGNVNQPISKKHFDALWIKASDHINSLDEHFVSHLSVGADDTHGTPVTVMTELAWHSLFVNNLFIRKQIDEPGRAWTMLNASSFHPDGKADGVNSDAAVILDFTQRRILVCGTHYAGEMKKAMFTVLNYLLPEHDILPMHCAANAGQHGDTALFFGLSGTGKTTLSADPDRFLIGDDEHGWGEAGVFNFEGGCYAKCIDLSQEREPLIWNAIQHGSVLENVVLSEDEHKPDYTDTSLTENTRAAYPRDFIDQCVPDNRGRQPDAVIFLTCDLFGVLPPVAKLSIEQAAYYFLSGYTAMVGSTEVGQGSGIKPTFSNCFGAPFFPRPPSVYAELLMKRLRSHPADVYLVNTGWTGGAHSKGGSRFSIPTTRAIITAIVNGELKQANYINYSGFNLAIPTEVSNVDSAQLDPCKNWQDQEALATERSELIRLFNENFARFDVSDAIKQAGPGS